jgi:hypothetical protein
MPRTPIAAWVLIVLPDDTALNSLFANLHFALQALRTSAIVVADDLQLSLQYPSSQPHGVVFQGGVKPGEAISCFEWLALSVDGCG